jgi:hypothetical protein
VLSAEECGADGGEVLESFAPTKFTLRVLAEGPPRPGASPCLDWSRDGTLYVGESAPDGTSGIVAWDVTRGKARAVALDLPAARLLFIVAGPGETLLVAYRPRNERPWFALVKKGSLQPPLDPSFYSCDGAFFSGRVMLGNGRKVVCFDGEGKRVWRLKGNKLHLGPTGTVAALDGEKLALLEPLSKEPRNTWSVPNKEGLPVAVRRRALVLEVGRTLTAVFADHIIRRVLPLPFRSIPSPSLRHVVQLADRMPVIDFRTGETQSVSLPPALADMRSHAPGGASWSPSGRRLALAAWTGELYLLEGE